MGKSKKPAQLVAALSAIVLAAHVTGTGSSLLFAVKNAVADAVYEYGFGKEDPKRLTNDLAKATPSVDSLVHNSRYADCVKLDCIDVSRYQKTIDWDRVANDGVQQAIVRMGYRGYGSEGSLVADPYFRTNIEEATRVGLEVGVYFYTQATTEKEAIEEANFVLDALNGYPLALPIYYDIEKVENATGRMDKANLTTEQRTKLCEAFCSTIQAAGYRAGVYANKAWLTNYLYADRLAQNYDIWLAHYTTSTSYSGAYQMWQFTASGVVDGIEGGVDRNVCYSRKANFIADVLTLSGMNASISPEYYGDGRLTFETSNSGVAVVDSTGRITAVGTGEADVTIYSTNGSADTVHVIVTNADIPYLEEPTEPAPAPSIDPEPAPVIITPEPSEIIVDITEPTEIVVEPTEQPSEAPTEPTEETTMENPTLPAELLGEVPVIAPPNGLVTPPAPIVPNESVLKYSTMLFNQLGETGISVDSSVRSTDESIVSVKANGSIEVVGVGRTELLATDENGNLTVCNVIVTDSDNGFAIGDSNLDGVVDSLDAGVILDYAANVATGFESYYLTPAHVALLDVNQDGVINSVDACAIFLHSAINGSNVSRG